MSNTNIVASADNVFSKMIRLQLYATAAVVVIAYLKSGMHGGLSALAGGLSVVLAAFIASKIAVSKRQDAASVLVTMLKAEAVKIFLIILFLYATFKGYKELVPWALIIGLAASAIISGAAISKQNDNLK